MPTAPLPEPRRALGPSLRPGALVLRRDARTLQIGTAPGITVRDRPGLVRVLRLLDGSLPLPLLSRLIARDVPEFTDDLAQTLTRLAAVGVVVPPSPAPEPRVAVRHDASTRDVARLIADGLGPQALQPDVEVLVSAGEPARSTFEVLVAAGAAHLPVVLDERRVRLGPFTIPSVSPCLGCLDAQLTAADPAWAALVPQFERPRLLAIALPRRLLLAAAAEAIHQVETLLRGERPSTIGHVLSLGPGHGDADLRSVPFSPACPCALLVA